MSTGRSQQERMAKYPTDLGESWHDGPKEVPNGWVVINQELRSTSNEDEDPQKEEGNESDTDPLILNKKKGKKDDTKKSEKLREYSSKAKSFGSAAANITGMAVSWLRKAAGGGSGLGNISGPEEYRRLR